MTLNELDAYVVALSVPPASEQGLRFVRRGSMLLPVAMGPDAGAREQSRRAADELAWALARPLNVGIR